MGLKKEKEEFCIYILKLKSRKTPIIVFYVGYTNNFERRFLEHLKGRVNFTSHYKIMGGIPVLTNITSKQDAMNLEKKYKSKSHSDKKIIYENTISINSGIKEFHSNQLEKIDELTI